MTVPQPPQHQPQPTPAGSDSAIAVTAKYHWSAFMFAMIKPQVHLDGHQLPGAWGRNVFPVQPGQHQVHAHVPYFLPPRIGPADATVDVAPGQVVEVEYRAPLWSFSAGSLGPPPQKYNGAAIMIGILVAVLAVFLCCCGLSLVSAMG